MTPTAHRHLIDALSPDEVDVFCHEWALWARDGQWPPAGVWRVWVLMAGRGYGKTRAGAEWIRLRVNDHPGCKIALVGETMDDVRNVMVEGNSGVMTISPVCDRPKYYPSRRLLEWPNGSIGFCFSAHDPEQLRGPEHHFAWCDEVAKWKSGATWDNLVLGMRLGENPQVMATTTPRARAWLRALIAEDGVVVTSGSTMQNRFNLSPNFIDAINARFGQSSLAKQEVEGRMLFEDSDALWTREMIDKAIMPPPLRKNMTEVMVAIDPAVGGADETGIVVVGRDHNAKMWVLDDQSLRASPNRWTDVVIATARRWRAMKLIVEVNQGGALIEDLLKTKGVKLPIIPVRARQGKVLRAEPVAVAYNEGLVFHGGDFNTLEEQMCNCIPGQVQQPSPDRLDAMVWGITALMRQERSSVRIIEF